VRRIGSGTVLRPRHGWLLIEVAVAVVLSAVLLGPLVTSIHSALMRADAVSAKASGLCRVTDAGVPSAWDWGAMITSAAWRPGPELDVETEGRGEAGRTVGLWVDGWFVGEHEADDDGNVHLGAGVWWQSGGCELLVRTRDVDGCWGPPWRTVVPATFSAVGRPATESQQHLTAALAEGAVTTFVHVPGPANPRLEMSWMDDPVEAGPLGLPFLLPVSGDGECGLTLGDAAQAWRAEAGRGLDLYF
jgi:hypothetical protein